MLTFRHGGAFIDLKTQDKHGQDDLLRMLKSFAPSSHYYDSIGNDLSRNIDLLVAHDADINVRDVHGQGCLHTLVSNFSFDCQYYNPEAARVMVDAASLLLRMGADIYAVDRYGFSVTEWVHYRRKGPGWEDALEAAGFDVEQVYQRDHNNVRKASDDCFAPKQLSPRRRGPFCKGYHNLTRRESIRRSRIGCHSMHELEDPQDEPTKWTSEEEKLDDPIGDNNPSPVSTDCSSDEEAGEEDESQSNENCAQGPDSDQMIEDPLDFDSDEEMGGVRLVDQ